MLDNIANWLNDYLPLVAFFLPLLVGLLTKARANEKLKATIMIILTGVAALWAQVGTGDVLTADSLVEWAGTITVTIASYYGVWKPIGAGSPLPERGIG